MDEKIIKYNEILSELSDIFKSILDESKTLKEDMVDRHKNLAKLNAKFEKKLAYILSVEDKSLSKYEKKIQYLMQFSIGINMYYLGFKEQKEVGNELLSACNAKFEALLRLLKED